MTTEERLGLAQTIFDYMNSHGDVIDQAQCQTQFHGKVYLDLFQAILCLLSKRPDPWFIIAVQLWVLALDDVDSVSLDTVEKLHEATANAAEAYPYTQWTNEEIVAGLASHCPEIRGGMRAVVRERHEFRKKN